MTSECGVTIEQDNDCVEDKVVVKRDSVLTTVLCRLSQFWPVRLAMRALRGFWWLLGFSPSDEKAFVAPEEDDNPSPARHCLAGRKRLRRATRILLAILPRRLQSALGYPVCTSIGCAVSPEVLGSPTKLCGKGNKRKQDDIDAEEQQTWAEALSQELADEEPSVDPDYEPSAVDTDSEEYNSRNDTESDIDVSEKGVVVIDDLKTNVPQMA
ncbi:oogenesis-related [Salmo trutta]|uniref:Oogenesis-related gene n=1 Tax=Salmo trutta TaxID=8032 RepID=A0A674BJ73_SALTR|nr:uncharacterized protein LOC115158258 [Salmo trutta]